MTQRFDDTIVALSTPGGYSGIGVIRMSGPESAPFLHRIFRATGRSDGLPDRRAVHGLVTDPESGAPLDDAIAVLMRGPRSYTGQDVVEISLHGSPTVLDMVVTTLVKLGARPAGRGEFTMRAFLSGKVDLIQAEAVIDLIESAGPGAVHEARGRLDRSLTTEVGQLSGAIKDLLALLEAHIDFDEEDEAPAPVMGPFLLNIRAKIDRLLSRARQARFRRLGLRTVIAGKPNVGKSTLFNALLGTDRTIVTPYPGTTRDLVEDRLALGGLSFVLSDTAGVRQDPEPIEQEGIRRTIDAIHGADLVIAVLDNASPLDDEDAEVLDMCPKDRTILVINKSDLPPHAEGPTCMAGKSGPILDGVGVLPTVHMSARTGQGMDVLQERLEAMGCLMAGLDRPAPPGGLTERGRLLVETARIPVDALLTVLDTGHRVEPAIAALELRQALEALEELTGERYDEGILERVFERFCVGK